MDWDYIKGLSFLSVGHGFIFALLVSFSYVHTEMMTAHDYWDRGLEYTKNEHVKQVVGGSIITGVLGAALIFHCILIPKAQARADRENEQ